MKARIGCLSLLAILGWGRFPQWRRASPEEGAAEVVAEAEEVAEA